MEAYNLFNRVNYNTPGLSLFNATGVASSTAGTITSTTAHNARQLQIALKLSF
jgi:hypothetical protein